MPSSLEILISAKDQASAAFKSVSKEITSTGNAARDLAGKGLDALHGGLNKVISVAKAGALAIAGLATAATAAVIGFATFGMKSASDMQKISTHLEQLTGSMDKAHAMMAQIDALESSTMFDFGDLAEAAGTMLQFGVGQEKVNEKLTMFADIAGDSAEKLNSLAYIYGRASSTGMISTRELSQLTRQNIPIVAELAKTYGIAADKVDDFVNDGKVGFKDVEKVLKSMTSKGGIFFEAQAKQIKTWDGMIHVGQNTIEEFARKLVGYSVVDGIKEGGIFAMLSSGLAVLTSDENAAKLGAFADSLGKTIVNIGSAIGGLYTLIVQEHVSQALGNMFHIDEDSPIVTFIWGVRKSVIGFVQYVIAHIPDIKAFFIDVFSKAYDIFVSNILPVLGTLFGLLVGFVEYVIAHIPDIQEFLVNIWTTAYDFYVANILPVLGWLYDAIVQFVTYLIENKDATVFALEAIGVVILASVVPGLVAAVVAAAPLYLMLAAIGVAAFILYKAWTENWGGIQEKVQTVIALVMPLFDQLKTSAMGAWDGIKKSLMGFWDSLVMLWNSIQPILALIAVVIAGAMVIAVIAINMVVQSFAGLITFLQGAVEIVSGVLDLIVGLFTGNGDKISSGFKKVVDGMGDMIKGFINTAIGLVNGLIDGFNDNIISAINTVPGFSIPKVPHIPLLAQGVNRVPKDMLAIIHKDEAVVPAKMNPFNPNATTNNDNTNNSKSVTIGQVILNNNMDFQIFMNRLNLNIR